MREGSTEYAIFICFHLGMFPVNALEVESKLGNPELPFPVSFFYGDADWMHRMDEQAAERVINRNKFKGTQSHVYLVYSVAKTVSERDSRNDKRVHMQNAPCQKKSRYHKSSPTR